MARDVDPRRTRKALRAVRKLASLQQPDPETGEIPAEQSYSDWEKEFLGEVEGRLEKYGSAFNDLGKGRPEEALSNLQHIKLKEIAAKASGKQRKGLQTRKPLRAKRPEKREDRGSD